MKPTPGPWKHNETYGLIKYGRTEICALHSGNAANAALIAAAPDLLEFAEEARRSGDARLASLASAVVAKQLTRSKT